MDSVSVSSWLMSRWRIGAVLASGLAVTCIYKISTETEEQRAQKAKRKRERELSRVAKQISKYAGDLHERYPQCGHVTFSELRIFSRWILFRVTRARAGGIGLLDLFDGSHKEQHYEANKQ